MRIRFDEQLKQLNKEMINMGTMIEKSIGDAVKALMKQDVELAQKVMAGDEEIDRTERKIEDLKQIDSNAIEEILSMIKKLKEILGKNEKTHFM